MFYFLDIDECAEGTDQCDSHADCTNTIGNHNCTCTVGFSGNGSTCGKHMHMHAYVHNMQ